MKRLAVVSILVGAVVAGFLFSRLPNDPGDTPAKKRILILGDSVAVGYTLADFSSTGYAPLVQPILGNAALVRMATTEEASRKIAAAPRSDWNTSTAGCRSTGATGT